MKGVFFFENFIDNPSSLKRSLLSNVSWDDQNMKRKVANFGVACSNSQSNFSSKPFIKELKEINILIERSLGFKPNNCFINYYEDGKSTMPFHSDRTDILIEDTGVGILSLGETRTIRFREKENHEKYFDYQLTSGSIIYISNSVQAQWEHSVIVNKTDALRISLSFRKLVPHSLTLDTLKSRCISSGKEGIDFLIIPERGNRRVIKIKEIIAIEAYGSYTKIHVLNRRTIVTSKNLKYYERLLSENKKLNRVHRSWIINLFCIKHINKTKRELNLEDDIVAKFSRVKKEEFRLAINLSLTA